MKKRVSTFARRIGRSLSGEQKRLLTHYLETIKIDSLDAVANNPFKALKLEIGFGNGEFLLNSCIADSESLYIGAEPYLNGVATLLREAEKLQLQNLRIYANDVRNILEPAPDHIFDAVNIICPDPWPKRRQHQRRLLQKEFIQLLHSKIKPGGTLLMVTDHPDYAQWIHRIITILGYTSQDLSSFKHLPENWIYTKYQKRGLVIGHDIYYFQIKT